VTGHADFIAKQLRLPKNAFTTCFKLFVAFFVSGLIHHSAEYTLYQKWGGHSMEFFLLQAVAITCEDIIISLAARAGLSSKPNLFYKFIGFVWTFGWFTYSLPMWLDGMIHAGMMDDGWKSSLILGLWRGDWTTKSLTNLANSSIIDRLV
jgi:Membrane bound O-acyl transferase family